MTKHDASDARTLRAPPARPSVLSPTARAWLQHASQRPWPGRGLSCGCSQSQNTAWRPTRQEGPRQRSRNGKAPPTALQQKFSSVRRPPVAQSAFANGAAKLPVDPGVPTGCSLRIPRRACPPALPLCFSSRALHGLDALPAHRPAPGCPPSGRPRPLPRCCPRRCPAMATKSE